MKKTLLSLMAFALSLAVNAQTVPFNGQIQKNMSATEVQHSVLKSAPKKAELAANQRYAGYFYDDDCGKKGEGMGIPQYTSGDCKAAIELTADMLKPYVGKKVVGIRFALCEKLSSSRVFIRPIIDNKISANDVVSKDVSSTQIGWNTVTLDEPYTIEENSNFFVGYDYEQKQSNDGQYYLEEDYPLSTSTVTADNEEGAIVIYANIPKTVGGSGIAWYTFSGQGEALSIQLIVEGDFNDYDVKANEMSDVTAKQGEQSTSNVSFLNFSQEPVTSLDYVVSLDGVAGEAQHVQLKNSVGRGSLGSFTATTPSSDILGNHNLSIDITKVNGSDNLSENKAVTGNMVVASIFYPKNILIEEFTTEKCPNCPRVAGYLTTALKTADASRVYAVCHHTGYYTDWLTGKWDTDLESLVFGGTGQTYAPAVTYNRDYSIAKMGYDQMGVMSMPLSAAEITAYINGVTSTDNANVKLTMTASKLWDDSQALITVEGECNEAVDKNTAKLTLYVTEDEVKARSQSGASGTFYHEHVIRYNNSSWGEAITWNDNKFVKTFTVPVNSSWVKNNLKFVALVNNYDAKNKDYKKINVENTIGMKYSDATTGINGVVDSTSSSEVARYSLDGMQLSAPQKGLNIVKLSDGRTVKVMVK